MNHYGVIMAGGGGTRFWPLSRKDIPKQFLNLTGSDLLVNETIDRLTVNMEAENIFVVTNETQAALMLSSTDGRIPRDHIFAEPAARNTAACIGYAAIKLQKKYGEGIMCILPSDHYIKDLQGYEKVMNQAIKAAENTDSLVTIGIKPDFPSTGYGYIKYNKGNVYGSSTRQCTYCHKVEEFVEKPNISTAKNYIADGSYLWNSGMFIWKTSVILKWFEKLLPDIYAYLMEIAEAIGTEDEWAAIERVYPSIPKISIDYGIMERAEDVLVLEGDFGWNDVGSWDALQSLYKADENGNVTYGEQLSIDSSNCIIYAKSKLIAALGVEDLIIVEAEDAVLVCHKDKAQEVKNIVEKLKNQGKDKYL